MDKDVNTQFCMISMKEQLIYLNWILSSLSETMPVDLPTFLVQSTLENYPDEHAANIIWAQEEVLKI